MKLFLIDGHALVFKMYYAFLGRPMVNGKGVDTSILFGFSKYLLELIDKEKPTHLAVSFDPPGGTFRNEMFPEYKANRAETPQLVIDALEPLTAIVKAMGIPVLMIRGFEADDVIGSAAKRFVRDGFDVYMVTPDKDYGQLVEPHVFQFRPGKAGGENELLGEAEICEKWGIDSTAQVIDILAICGDTADNVPGVQGVGPVGASKLLRKYGTLESIYEHLEELTPGNRQKFEAARGHIALSKELVTIKTDIDLDVTDRDLELDNVNTPEVKDLFTQYEMPSLLRLLDRISPAARTSVQVGPDRCDRTFSLPPRIGTRDCADAAIRGGALAINLVGDELYAAVSDGVASDAPAAFRQLLENPDVTKIGAGLKEQMNRLHEMGIEVRGRLEDIELMHYLLNPERSHKLEVLAKSYLGVDLETSEPKETGSLFDEVDEDDAADHTKETAAMMFIAGCLKKEMAETEGMQGLYDRIEEPLIGVLARMEQAGVKIDLASLKDFADGLRVQMLEREREVREIAGVPDLNVSSPKQIGEVIFEKLKLDPKAKRPKTGSWPTDEQTLQELSGRSPIIDAILDYRGLRKLLSTYIEPFPGYVSRRDGRVHTTFNQALTSTGRLSSSNPNLQNIPVRTEQGREIRKAFVAEDDGKVIMSADYSQIELRIMAHLCGDEHMCAAFREGIDVHAATAAKIFHCRVEDVTADQRRVAKTANFGIMYGISAFGLSQRLKCSRAEAKKIIDDYFESFPSIRGFIDRTLAGARENGYVETLFGRRRYVPDVNSHNANVRALAERNAVNAPIQGTSADIIKLAMAGVDRKLREAGLGARMVLQIHDELVLEVPVEEIEEVKNILVEQMESVIKLSVPLTVECSYGKTWLEAH